MGMRRLFIALATALTAALLAAGPAGAATYTPSGTSYTVNNRPGDQTDAHISGSLVSYTDTATLAGTTVIRYKDLATGQDNLVPTGGPGSSDYLSDLYGTKMVFTRSTPTTNGAIMLFDTGNPSAPPTELAPQTDSARNEASIGGDTVAWQDFGYSTTGLDSAIVVYDIASKTTTRLTTDATLNQLPAVSPDGNVVTWLKCDPNSGGSCDVYDAVKSGSGWSIDQLTTTGDAAHPDTNGQIVVYSRGAARASSVVVQPVAGGAEQQLALTGSQANPSIDGNYVVFENTPAGQTQTDLQVAELRNGSFDGKVYKITDTPNTNEVLSDISVNSSGEVTVTWVASGSGLDVYAFKFRAQTTPEELCALTVQDIQSSAEYQSLPPALRAAIDAQAKAICQNLETIVAGLTPAQKAFAIAVYKFAVQQLAAQGFFTSDQATTLKDLADTL